MYQMFNETTRKFEEINIDEAELLPGQKVIRRFWCNSDQRWVTVPGQSIYTVNQDLNLELTND